MAVFAVHEKSPVLRRGFCLGFGPVCCLLFRELYQHLVASFERGYFRQLAGYHADVDLIAVLFGVFLVLEEYREVVSVGGEIYVAVEPAVVYVLLFIGQRVVHYSAEVVRVAADADLVGEHLDERAGRLAVVEDAGDYGVAEVHQDFRAVLGRDARRHRGVFALYLRAVGGDAERRGLGARREAEGGDERRR